MATPNKISSKIKKKIISYYKCGSSSREIAKKFNINHNTVLYHLNKLHIETRNGTLKEISKDSNNLTLEKAYVLGVVGPGDGYVVFNSKHKTYKVGLKVISRKFANYFDFCLRKVFGLIPSRSIVKPKRKTHNKQYVVELNSKLAYVDLQRYNVSFKEENWRIPEIIKNATEKIKCMYLRGFADSQGCVLHYGRRIELASKNKEGLNEMKELLVNVGIKDCSVNKNGITVTARRSLETFAKKINFIIPYKKDRLEKLLNNYKLWITPKKDVVELMPKIFYLNKKGLTHQQIADKLNVSRTMVTENLGKLKQYNSETQTEYVGIKR